MPKKKTISAEKKTAEKNVTKAVKKTVKKSVAKKTAKKSVTKPTKKAVKKKTAQRSKSSSTNTPEPKKKEALKQSVPVKPKAAANTKVADRTSKNKADDTKPASIVFSFEDVERLMAAKKREPKEEAKVTKMPTKKAAPAIRPKSAEVEDKPQEHRKLGAASLADILGFNPAEKKKNTALNSDEVPQKWKKYYKLLIELRVHVRDEIDLHSSETLKHSNRDDSGDLSGYGSHQADAGTDSFDRDFALSLVSNEHEALNEIEDAIQRIKKGTYGICEVTGKPIPGARLTAVPFARYSVEGQAEYEKNLRRKVDRSGSTGLFGDTSDAPKLAADDDDE